MDELKLLLVIDNLGSGGAQNQLTLLAVELKKRGYDVSVFTYYPQDFFKPRLTAADVPHIASQKSGKLGLSVVKHLVRLFNANHYDVVLSFLDTPNFYTSLAAKFAQKKPKLIASYRSKSNIDDMPRLKRKQKEWVNKRGVAMVANSHHERERWQKAYPATSAKWHTIYNAVDRNKFKPNTSASKSDSFLVIGSIGPAKNGLLLIEALHLLKQQGVIIPLTWIGQKVTHIAARKTYLEAMENKIAAYDLSDQWTWKAPTEAIEKEYNRYKALILASKREGLPNVVCEALCCGLPCLVSNVLDHPRLVQNNKSGFLFDPDNAQTLSEAISKMNTLSTDQYEQMKTEAKETGQRLFDLSSFVDHYEKLLKEVC